MCCCEMGFEVGPYLVRLLLVFPVSTVVWKHTCVDDGFLGGGDDLENGVRVVV